MFKLIFQSAPVVVIFGPIAYRDDTRQWNFHFFQFLYYYRNYDFKNTEKTTFLHVKMTVQVDFSKCFDWAHIWSDRLLG